MFDLFDQEFPGSYSSDEECEAYLFRRRWPDGFCCPRCEHERCYTIRTRKLFECCECGTQVSVTAGTIFHNSKLPLWIWFKAIALLTCDGAQYSSLSLAEVLGVNYRTARLMLSKIQHALHKIYKRDLPKVHEAINSEPHLPDEKMGIVGVTATVPATSNVPLRAYFKSTYSQHNILMKWMDAFTSVLLYPRFLKYWKLWY